MRSQSLGSTQHTFDAGQQFARSGHPIFDASVLGTMFGQESALISRLLQTFVSSTHASLAQLIQAVATRDLGGIASLAHKMAGASCMSGALALGQCARNQEPAARRGDASAIPQAIADLQAQ